MIFRRRITLVAFAFSIPIFILASRGGERGVPASEGIGNFGKVNNSLYRGAQPDATGIKSLKSLGVKSIINLRTTRDDSATEEMQARASGIVYTNVPLAGLSRPTDEEITKVLSLITNLPGPVFVHCEHGCDRTGTIIACYRIQHDHWSCDNAIAEAEKYGISKIERGMRRYIADFAARNQPNSPPPKP
jgi:tyrosine-protein phosphatase SIW14